VGPVNTSEGRFAPGAIWTIVVLMATASLMSLNETVLGVALKTLREDLELPLTSIQWVVSVFPLTMAVVVPTTGYLLVRFTERQVFVAATALFATGALACALSPGFMVLVGGRVLQAAGTALTMPLLMTTVMRLVPSTHRGSVIGMITVVTAVAPALGPTVGGIVLDSLGWRWLFWLALPLMAKVITIGAIKFRPGHTPSATPLDVLSVPLAAPGFGGLLYGLSTIGEDAEGTVTTPTVTAVLVGVGALAGFIARQVRLQRSGRALLDLGVLTHRRFAVAVGIVALLFTCMMAVTSVLLPLYLQTVLARSTTVSGLVMLPGGLAMGLLGPLVGRLYDRFGARVLVLPGAGLTTVALGLFASLGAETQLWRVVMTHLLLMAGVGTMMTPLNTYALSSLPDHLYSHGSAILTTIQQVAGAFGIALFATIATLASANSEVATDVTGFRAAFTIMAVIGVAALALALLVDRPAGPHARTDHGRPGR